MQPRRAKWVAEVADRAELVGLLQAALAHGTAAVILPESNLEAGAHVLQIQLEGKPAVVLAAELEERLGTGSFELRLWPLDPSHVMELSAIVQESGDTALPAGPASLSISAIFDAEPPLPEKFAQTIDQRPMFDEEEIEEEDGDDALGASVLFDPEAVLIGRAPARPTGTGPEDTLTVPARSSLMPPPEPGSDTELHVRDRQQTLPDAGSAVDLSVTVELDTSPAQSVHPADGESYSVVFGTEETSPGLPPSKPPRPPGVMHHRDTLEWTQTLPLDPDSQRAAQSARDAASRAEISSGRGPRTQRRTGPVGVLGQGRIIANRYRIDSLVGAGAIGAVYKATHVDLPRTFAIKVLHPHYRADTQLLASFRTEAQAASLLDHPNVTVVHDFGEDPDGIVYIVMEFLAGVSLQAVLDEVLRLSPVRAINIMLQVCGALAAAHERGIIHRDVKPDNIMLIPSRDDEGRPFEHVKVCDFGIAALESAADEADPEWTAGTPEYMAPEQAHGRADARTDVYACGIVLYEMVTGRPPFVGESPLAVLAQQMNQRPRPLSEALPGFPTAFEAVILRCLEKQPERRYATMRELRVELKRLL